MHCYKIFFLNTGRSGSKAVARFFKGFHEPDSYSPTVEKVEKRIKKYIKEGGVYVESSLHWMWNLDELVAGFPDAFLVHLVRDGRNTVKSLWHWQTIYGRYEHAYPIKERLKLPIPDFQSMDRFEKLCWYWRYYNERIEKVAHCRVRLEDIAHIIPLVNKGKQHPPWTEKERETFERVCGELNRKYGYGECIDGDKGNTVKYWDNLWADGKKRCETYAMKRALYHIKQEKPKSVLEVGCGVGKLLHLAKIELEDCEVFGVDISSNAVRTMKKRYGVDGKAINAYDISELSKKFDFIVANHLLEHIYKDEEFLETCKSILNDGGVMFAAVPNDMSPPEQSVEHVNMYNKESMEALFKKVFGNCEMGLVGNHLIGIGRK